MKFSFVDGDPASSKADVLVLPLFESDLSEKKNRSAALSAVDRALGGIVLAAAQEEGFQGKADQTFTLHTHGRIPAARLVLVGLGARAKFDPEVLRLAAGRAVKTAAKVKAKTLTFALPPAREMEPCVKAAVEGLLLGSYKFDRYRTVGRDAKSGRNAGVQSVSFALPDGVAHARAFDEMVALGQKVAEAVNWARNLVNEPAGVMTPQQLAAEARSLASLGLKVTVRGRKEIEKLRMGMFLGVAQGSVKEPQFIEVAYTPKNPKDAKKPAVALVGKAITFDSGGLSLKSAEGMVDMKTDMAGSAAVLGAMRVVAQLKPPFPVRAYMGACENMPSGHAYRPGDVLVSRLGKTVEITNTDAEGRLVLGDMLTWASESKPAIIVDLATLTGACMIALGHHIVGAWGEDDEAVESVLEAARSAGEMLWRMPLHELQRDALRSEVADMKNSGERWGGAINAAMFLKEFVVDTPWVHLDIAGPSQSPKERGYHQKGATGVGVRTLVELIRRRAAEEMQAGR
ncbi:MAG: leucyl aminopeptidase [Myxococcaceae bacterium]|nr:leucyl aminopeptidase [Myxococcaceae bacterium]